MLIVGLTGLIGSGKSLVAAEFASLGAVVVDADELARKAVEPGSPGLKQVEQVFGVESLTSQRELNRAWMAERVFKDPLERRKLEAIIHPEVRRLFRIAVSNLERLEQPPKLIVAVIPLLFQARRHYPEIQKTIVVLADLEKCLRRIIERDHVTRDQALRRTQAQQSPDTQRQLADIIIENNDTPEALRRQVRAIYRELVE